MFLPPIRPISQPPLPSSAISTSEGDIVRIGKEGVGCGLARVVVFVDDDAESLSRKVLHADHFMRQAPVQLDNLVFVEKVTVLAVGKVAAQLSSLIVSQGERVLRRNVVAVNMAFHILIAAGHPRKVDEAFALAVLAIDPFEDLHGQPVRLVLCSGDELASSLRLDPFDKDSRVAKVVLDMVWRPSSRKLEVSCLRGPSAHFEAAREGELSLVFSIAMLGAEERWVALQMLLETLHETLHVAHSKFF